jgi:hypothetical protein
MIKNFNERGNRTEKANKGDSLHLGKRVEQAGINRKRTIRIPGKPGKDIRRKG